MESDTHSTTIIDADALRRLPDDPREFLDSLFPHIKRMRRQGRARAPKAAYPQERDPAMLAEAGSLIAQKIEQLAESEGGYSCVARYVGRAIENGPAASYLMGATLDILFKDAQPRTSHPIVTLGRSMGILSDDNTNLRGLADQHETLFWLINEWWRGHHPDTVDSEPFNRAWEAWTQQDNEAMALGRRRVLTAWRREALEQIAEQTQAETETTLDAETTPGRVRRAM